MFGSNIYTNICSYVVINVEIFIETFKKGSSNNEGKEN